MFFRTPFLLPLLFPRFEWRVATKKKEVFLTFDDGPVPGPTEFVLEELAKFNIHATFFCIGDNVRKHPDVFKKIVDAGHAVGNHTFNHLKGWTTANADYAANIGMCDDVFRAHGLEALEGKKLFRPPYGRIRMSQAKQLTGYRIIMWDVLTQDYDQLLNKENCLAGTLRAVRPGSIVVLHDSLKAERNLRYVLPRLLISLSQAGYTFRTLACGVNGSAQQ